MPKKGGGGKSGAPKSMGDAVNDLRVKQSKAQAALADSGAPEAENGAGVKGAVPAGISAASALSATSQLLESYRELVATSTRTLEQLPADDPARAELLEAITSARAAWLELLFDGDEDITEVNQALAGAKDGAPDAGAAGDALASAPAVEQGSTALVPVTPGPVPVVRRKRYPDEAVIARYWRRRRARHEWPDEAAIKRFFRKRRERGPVYPDEATIARRLRIWNEDI